MKGVLAVLLVLAVVASASKLTHHAQFLAWKQAHGKSYLSTAHEAHAFTNFKQALARVAAKEAAGVKGYGLNGLSDLSAAEFKAKYLSSKTQAHDANAKVLEQDVAAAPPATFNWLTYDPKAVTAVKDQGDCGSCWAFSATEALESQWYLTNHSVQILSPQQTVSCDTVDEGCDGGDLPTAYTYIKGAGVETEASYPYTSGDSGETGTCKYSKSKVVASITGYQYVIPACTDDCTNQEQYSDQLKTALAAGTSGIHGPPAICVYAESWQDWVGPDPLTDDCPMAYEDLDHCVQLVGYNTTAAYGSYWIVRNSWNTDWGVKGFIYVQSGKNLCGILDEVVFPIVTPATEQKAAPLPTIVDKLKKKLHHKKHF